MGRTRKIRPTKDARDPWEVVYEPPLCRSCDTMLALEVRTNGVKVLQCSRCHAIRFAGVQGQVLEREVQFSFYGAAWQFLHVLQRAIATDWVLKDPPPFMVYDHATPSWTTHDLDEEVWPFVCFLVSHGRTRAETNVYAACCYGECLWWFDHFLEQAREALTLTSAPPLRPGPKPVISPDDTIAIREEYAEKWAHKKTWRAFLEDEMKIPTSTFYEAEAKLKNRGIVA